MNRREVFIGGGLVGAAALMPLQAFSAIADLAKPVEGGNWAQMLEGALAQRNVRIDRPMSILPGAKLTDFGGLPIWQKYISFPKADRLGWGPIANLADTIADVGSRVKFIPLWPPNRGVIDASIITGRKVIGRSLDCYEIMSDSIITRFDVLFARVG